MQRQRSPHLVPCSPCPQFQQVVHSPGRSPSSTRACDIIQTNLHGGLRPSRALIGAYTLPAPSVSIIRHDFHVVTMATPCSAHGRRRPANPRFVWQDPEGFVEDGGWDFLNQEADGSGEEDEEEEGTQPQTAASSFCHRDAEKAHASPGLNAAACLTPQLGG